MAYTVTTEALSVKISPQNSDLMLISIKFVVLENGSPVCEFVTSKKYNKLVDNETEFKTAILNDFKTFWDKWKQENILLNSSKLGTVLSQLATQSQTYVNL